MKTIMVVSVLFLSGISSALAQENAMVADMALPHQPGELAPKVGLAPVEDNAKKSAHHGFWYYANPTPRTFEEGIMWGGCALDMVGTFKNVTHPQWYNYSDKYGSIYSTKIPFTEGWATLFGNRNAAGAIGINLAIDWGVQMANRRLAIRAARGGKWWKVAKHLGDAFLVEEGAEHVYYGIGNFRYDARMQRVMKAWGPGGCWQNSPVAIGTPAALVCH
jgi:hypothetical protein